MAWRKERERRGGDGFCDVPHLRSMIGRRRIGPHASTCSVFDKKHTRENMLLVTDLDKKDSYRALRPQNSSGGQINVVRQDPHPTPRDSLDLIRVPRPKQLRMRVPEGLPVGEALELPLPAPIAAVRRLWVDVFVVILGCCWDQAPASV